MKPHKILQIIAILISLFGTAYMGYQQGKGVDDDYGIWIVFAGLVLLILSFLIKKKETA